jgi:DNA-binding NtrC family response regulator
LEDWVFERIGGTRTLPLNARIIASTNQDLKKACRTRSFRADLYYRLSTAEVRIPPLRSRREDIPILVRHLMNKAELQMDFSSGAFEAMMNYAWPGNVRELRNFIRWLSFLDLDRAVSPEDVLHLLSEPPAENGLLARPAPTPRGNAQGGAERDALMGALASSNYNFSLAAKHLGVSRTTLYAKMRRHGIQVRKTSGD